MEPPFQQSHYHFRTYQDFMGVIPESMRHLPVYITEADQDDPWEDANRGWVQRAYAEIDRWNQAAGNQQIRALVLYRWRSHDRWHIEGEGGVHEDFQAAMAHRYQWRPDALPAPPAPLAGALTTDSSILGPASGSQAMLAGYLKRTLPPGHEYTPRDVDLILGHYWQYAPAAGVDPFLAVVQSLYDTGGWRSVSAARPYRNPACLGQGAAPGGLQAFATWEEAVRAHVAYLRGCAQEDNALSALRGQRYAEAVVVTAEQILKGENP